jgi:uncharacterized membrane protein
MERIKIITATVYVILTLCIATTDAEIHRNVIRFDNQSGESALVKVVGKIPKIVEVAKGQKKSVNVAAGEYYILVRYGDNPERYRYSRGETFTVRETSTQYSKIAITLHKVIGGNYATNPTSVQEFDKTIATDQTKKPDKAVVLQVQKKLNELGYNPGPIDGILGGATRAALKSFQKKNNLRVTGKINPETSKKLFQDTAESPGLKTAEPVQNEFQWKWVVVSKGGTAPDNHSGKVLTISFENPNALSSETFKSLEKSVKLVDENGNVFFPFSATHFKEFKGYDADNNLVQDLQNLYRLSFPVPSTCANYTVEWVGMDSFQACNPCKDCDIDPLAEISKLSAKGRSQSFFWGNVKK